MLERLCQRLFEVLRQSGIDSCVGTNLIPKESHLEIFEGVVHTAANQMSCQLGCQRQWYVVENKFRFTKKSSNLT